MTPDENKELKELVEFLKENGIGEFEFERGDLKVRIKFGQPGQATAASALDLARLGQLLSPGQNSPPAVRRASMPWLPLRRLRPQMRPQPMRGGAAHRQIADRGHLLRVFLPGRPGLCQGWR